MIEKCFWFYCTNTELLLLNLQLTVLFCFFFSEWKYFLKLTCLKNCLWKYRFCMLCLHPVTLFVVALVVLPCVCMCVYCTRMSTYEIIDESCPEGIQPRAMKNGDIYWRRYKIQEIFYVARPQFPSKLAPWDFTQFSQSLSAALLYFPESHRWSEISFLSKVIFVLGKARSLRVPNLGYREAASPGWFHIPQKNSV